MAILRSCEECGRTFPASAGIPMITVCSTVCGEKRITELQAELEGVDGLHQEALEVITEWKPRMQEVKELQEQNRVLREIAMGYSGHKSYCKTQKDPPVYACNCGFAKAWEALAANS